MYSSKTRESALSVDNVSLSFGGVKAITEVSIEILKGEICSVIGPNGAGKSSMLNIFNGVYKPQQGKINFEGRVFKAMKPRKAAKLGIARTFQNIGLFGGMSVVDNLMTGRNLLMRSTFVEQSWYLGRTRADEMRHRRRVEEVIEFMQIQSIRKTLTGGLPYGMQKRVELARTLAAEPKLMLLDEPMAGMNMEEKLDLSCFIQEINREFGTTIVLIEHDMGVVMDISDHVIAMDFGKKIADGVPEEIKNDPAVIESYLGAKH